MAKVVNFEKSSKAKTRKAVNKVQQAKNEKKNVKMSPEELEELRKKLTQKEKRINLAELVNASVDFIRGDISVDEMAKIGDKLTIRNYIPILDKYKIMMSLVFDMNQTGVEQGELATVNLERDLFFKVLLGEYAMVDVSDENLWTYYNYDLLYPIFMPYILQYCCMDYEKLVKMIDKSLDIYHMHELSDMLSSVDYQELERNAEENRNLIEALEKNKDLVANLKELLKANNPMADMIVSGVQKEAIDSINEQMRKARGLDDIASNGDEESNSNEVQNEALESEADEEGEITPEGSQNVSDET